MNKSRAQLRLLMLLVVSLVASEERTGLTWTRAPDLCFLGTCSGPFPTDQAILPSGYKNVLEPMNVAMNLQCCGPVQGLHHERSVGCRVSANFGESCCNYRHTNSSRCCSATTVPETGSCTVGPARLARTQAPRQP